MPLAVRGLAQLTRTFNNAPKDVKKAYRQELRTVAVPLQQMTERLNVSSIRKMRFSPEWAQSRIGVTQRLVYVAPKQRGRNSRRNPNVRRPNLKELMLVRSYDPALARNAPLIEGQFGLMLDRLLTKWGREGP